MVKHSSDPLGATFSALADPTRRAIVARLVSGETTIGELAKPFATTLPATLKHIRVLEKAGLIVTEKRRRSVWCRLEAEPLREVARWISHYERFWQDRLDALEAYLENDNEEDPSCSPSPPPTPPPSGSPEPSEPSESGSSAPGRTRRS